MRALAFERVVGRTGAWQRRVRAVRRIAYCYLPSVTGASRGDKGDSRGNKGMAKVKNGGEGTACCYLLPVTGVGSGDGKDCLLLITAPYSQRRCT